MITRIEALPNEILLCIFSYLEWFDMLTCLWSLNIRFNSLICSVLSINNNLMNSGLAIRRGLSYNKCCSILFPLILNSSSLSSSIRRIHLDGNNSSAYDLCYEWLFNDKNILHFPNLKSLVLTQCGSIRSIVQSLLYLIQYQLDNLTLTFDNSVLYQMLYVKRTTVRVSDIEKQMIMFEQFLYKLFSDQCQLTSLQLDISSDCRAGGIHQCLNANSYVSSKFLQHQHQSCCLTLRHLYIRLNQTCFLENLIEHVPNIEQLLVEFDCSLGSFASWKSNVEILKQSKTSWFNKIPKLQDFSLKTFIQDDFGFIYLKWLLNNLNYIEKLKVHIKNDKLTETKCQNIWKCLIDANFEET
ncbi:unnamed protein product [Rotaria sp. Silwood2]|nr:unnamed protein product [Rotaria sp. Silwood2]